MQPPVSRDEWISQMIDMHMLAYAADECGDVLSDRTVRLDGEQAGMRSFRCPVDGPDAVAVQVLATHSNEGWALVCGGDLTPPAQLSAFEQECQSLLAGFHFGL
jgi:hypothetical protein